MSPNHLVITTGLSTNLAIVEELVLDKHQQLEIIKENLEKALLRIKDYADKKRTERTFEVNNLVYLKLQPYRQGSVPLGKKMKLAPRLHGPYKILEKVGTVAYRLELPSS